MTKVINGLDCLCILAFSLHQIDEGFPLLIGQFTLFLHFCVEDIYRNTTKFEHYQIKQKVFVATLFQSQNAFSLESLHLFLTQRTHLLHIIFKFTLQSWQVPRSSVGRALYRESGPSQDGDPVPGNLPFFSLLLFFNPFCELFLTFFVLQPVYKHSGEALLYSLFTSIYQQGLSSTKQVYPFPSRSVLCYVPILSSYQEGDGAGRKKEKGKS